MGFNRKIKKLILSVLTAACVSSAAVGVAGCMPKSVDKSEPTDRNVRTDRETPPTDGSLPTAYSAAENLAYIVGKFDSQTQYHTYTEGVTAAAIATQVTKNWKDYKNGVLVNSDITYSSLVKTGTQSCTVFGKDENGERKADTYFRLSETPEANSTSTSVEWKQDAPTYFTENAYNYTYGFLPNELFNYAVNADTIISSEEIVEESNGTYTLKFTLDNEDSTFFYQFGMKTRGGLSDYPDFQQIKFEVNFNADWQINKSKVHEVSTINKGIVVSSVSDFETVYYYGEDNFDNTHFAYYSDYYKKYLGDSSLDQGGDVDEELVMDVTNVLSNGFASVLNGGQQFEISATLGANKYVGYVFLGLSLEDIAGSLNLKLSLGKTLNDQDLYVEYSNGDISAYYGDDFALTANIAAVKLEIDKFAEIIEGITTAVSRPADTGSTESSSTQSGSDPLADLMNSMVLEAGENQATLILKTDDLLGLGIGIDAKLVFGIYGNSITFRGANVGGLALGGQTLDVNLALKTTTAPLISHNPSKTPTDLADYVADVYKLLSSDLIKVTAEINGNSDKVALSALKGVNVKVDAYADLDGIALGADASASYTYNGKTISAKINAIYEYNQNTGKYGNAYLSLKEFNGVEYDLNVRCDVNELVSAITAMLNNAGAANSQDTGKLVSALNQALSVNISSLLTEMYSDGTAIKMGISVDTVMEMLGVDAGVKFGSCNLVYERGEGTNGGNLSASLPSIGFAMNVCGEDGELQKPNDEDYFDLNDLIEGVQTFIDAKAASVGISFNGANFTAMDIPELANLTANATIYVDFKNNLAARVEATVAYQNISAKITADYIYDSTTNGTVILTLTELCGEPREVKIYCQVNEVVEGVKTLLTYFGNGITTTATESATTNLIDVNTVLANLLTADINALIPNLEAKANVLNLTVNVDEVLKLLNVSVNGLTVGEVALEYNSASENLLTLNAPNFGLTATVNPYNGNLEEATIDNALNLNDVLTDVNEILNAKKLAVALNFNGNNFTAANVNLSGLTATATAYVDFATGLTAQVEAAVSYKVDESKSISATVKVYFKYDANTIGDLIVVLDSINGVATSAKVRCNVSELSTAIQTLISYVAPKNDAVNSTESATATDPATQTAASVLDKLITADFAKLITDINASANIFNLSVNVDEILNLFDLNLGLTLGEATLEYTHSNEGESSDLLTLCLANAGVTLTVNPTDIATNFPAYGDALDLTQLINVVNNAISQINTIKADGKLYFEIAKGTDETPATYLYLDGILVEIWGKGEISWKVGEERVVLDLSMSISETGKDITTLKLVYDKTKAPLVKVALNSVGIEIYQEDIDGVKNGFIEIYNKLAILFGLEPIATGTSDSTATGSTESSTSAAASSTNLGSPDRLLALIFNLLASDDWVNEINNFTATCNGKSFALGYLSNSNNANVAITTEGGLSIAYDGAFGERFSLGGIISVKSVGETPLSISFTGCNMASSKEGTTEFIRLAYNFLFESIHGISVENILGSNTYAVTFELNGANTEVADLKDVYVKAEIYVTDEASINSGKLAEGLLVLDVKGVAINLHVITEYDDFGKAKFYINLNRVADILLPDLKLLATQDSLYETFKVLFNTINDTKVLDMVSKLLPARGTADGTTEEQPATGESQPIEEGTLDKVASILEKILNLNFSQAVVAHEVDGVQYADIDLDNFLGQLGINVGTLGKLSVEINHNTHAMTTSGVAMVTNSEGIKEAKEWISLSSEKTPIRTYNDFKREDYLNIEFLPYLIEDIVKFATDDSGNVYEKFTLSGTITANIVSMFSINIDVANLTISIADNDFYFSGVLHVKKMSALGLVTIPDSTVGITYQNGYLTLARGLNGSTPEYRIMTFDYFMDHMLVKADSDCVLKWWLNISGWDTVMSIINSAAGELNVESGLTRTENVYLYDQSKKGQTQLISMYDYVEALKVMVNGTEYASFGDMSSLEKEFGIYDNYYGFSLNARKVTGDVLTKLYAAIIRTDNGISAIKASGAIQSFVTFAATLNYEEGATQEYTIGSSVQSGLVAPSMYTAANAIITAQGLTVDYDHFVKNEAAGYDEKFGCFNLYYNSTNSNYDASYGYSNILYQHTLTIVNLDGTTETRQVRQGSTIYLYDNLSPLYTDETKQFRQLYTTTEGVIGATQVVMNTDLTVYALRVKAIDVIAISGSEQYTITSFIGDKVPTTIDGLETIGAVTYEDGTQVGENDYITEELLNGSSKLNVYGTFVQSIVEVNGINYEFTYDNTTSSGYYTVAGKASSFNTTLYCGSNGKTLVLENEIGGYPVTAIAAEALANVDGHALRSVVVPSNIVSVGERAFLDNIGIEEVVFLAENVTMYGKAGSTKTMPFYGCSVLSTDDKVNGQEGNEVTYLKVYYHNITSASGDNWRHFRHVSKVFSFNSYIGEDGGATISSGWDYVTASAVVELNGITGSALTQSAAEEILSRYYPLISEEKFTGSLEIETAIAVDFAQFDMTKNGITYTCSISAEYGTVDGFTHVTYTINYTKAKIIYVYSDYEITYYGTKVPAKTKTKITVPVTGEEVVLETPTEYTHKFVEWNIATENGEEVYNVVWAEKATYSLKIRLTRGGFDTNIVHVLENGANEKTYRINGNVTGGTTDVTSILIYEGQATFTLNNNKLTVVTGNITYTIFVNDAEVTGSDKGIQRVISSSITGTQTVSGDMTVTFKY